MERVWLDPSLLSSTQQRVSPWVMPCPFLSACPGGTLREANNTLNNGNNGGCDLGNIMTTVGGNDTVPPSNASCGLDGTWYGQLCKNGTGGVLWYGIAS